mgnify:CR=1 FL=1
MSGTLPFPTRSVFPRREGPLRVGFCVSGGGRLCRAAVEHAAALGIAPSALILDRRAADALDAWGRDAGMAVHRLAAPRRPELDGELIAAFDAAPADLWMLTFDKILPQAVVLQRRGRIVNVHMALLPAFAGMHGIRQTLAGGARFGGATIHEVDEEMDHGPTVVQCALPLVPEDTEESAGLRLWPLLHAAYLQVLAWYAAGRVVRDDKGRLWVAGAQYGAWPVSPAVELPERVACPAPA